MERTASPGPLRVVRVRPWRWALWLALTPDLPERSSDWRREMLKRARSMRAVLARHPWAIALMESRAKAGPANLQHHDAVIGSLRHGGFSLEQTAHAYSLIDSYLYGSALEQANLAFRPGDDVGKLAQEMLARFPMDAYPDLAAFTFEHVMRPGYDYGAEFEYGIGLILDALARVRGRADGPDTARSSRATPAPPRAPGA